MLKNLVLNEDEFILKVVRQARLILIVNSLIPGLLIILPFFFLYFLFNWGGQGIIIFFSALVLGLVWLARVITIWWLKIFIITSQRIIDVDQKGLLQKIVSDVPLTKIQDIYYQTKGIKQTLSRLGNLDLILTDSKTIIEIKNINRPQRIQQLILAAKADGLKEKLDDAKLSAKELVALVDKIKAGIGEEKFNEILKQNENLAAKETEEIEKN